MLFTKSKLPKPDIYLATAANDAHRLRNEDAVFTCENGLSAGVFDGVSSKEGSEAAAQYMAEYCKEKGIPPLQRKLTSYFAETAMKMVLDDAEKSFSYTHSTHIGYPVLSTTALLAGVFYDPERRVPIIAGAYAGDSRACRIENGRIVWSTLDHSISPPFFDGWTEEQSARYIQDRLASASTSQDFGDEGMFDVLWDYAKRRYGITSWIDNNPSHAGTVDTFSFNIGKTTSLLLLTDGIHDNLTTQEIEWSMGYDDPASTLVEWAQSRSREPHFTQDDTVWNFRPKHDDMTAVVMRWDQ